MPTAPPTCACGCVAILSRYGVLARPYVPSTRRGMVVLDEAAGSVAAQKLFLLITAEVLANQADVTIAAAVIRIQKWPIANWNEKVAQFEGKFRASHESKATPAHC